MYYPGNTMMHNEEQILRGFHAAGKCSHKRALSEIALLEAPPRAKRQHYRVMIQRHCDYFLEHGRDTGFSCYATAFEGAQNLGELCSGFHSIVWHSQYTDRLRAHLGRGTQNHSLLMPSGLHRAMETLHCPSSDSLVNSTTTDFVHSSESRRSGKRKLFFDDYTRSVRSFGHPRFSSRLGGSRLDSGELDPISAPLFPVYDGSQYSRYNDAMTLPLHPLSFENEVSRQNNAPSHTWRLRRLLENKESRGIIGLASPLYGSFSAASFGSENRTFALESFKHPCLLRTYRGSYSASLLGTSARDHFSNEGMHDRVHNPAGPSSSLLFYRTERGSTSRESVLGSSQSVPLEAFPTSSRYASEPTAGWEPSVHAQGFSTSVSDYGEGRRLTPRSISSRGPRRRWQQRVNHQRRSLSNESVNQSEEYAEVNIADQQRNMQLDVDNMSYEELLVLGERIGNVQTGLSDDRVQKGLKMSKYSTLSAESSASLRNNEVLCSICQEEYRENDELALLVCGHSHHPACIKQWLRVKNQCPICKAVAYAE